MAAACGLLLLAMSTARAQETAEMKTLALVTLSGYDELMLDVDFIGSLAGQPQASEGIKGFLNLVTQQKGLAGLDTTKPIGVLLQSDGEMMIGGAVCLPVTDLPALLDAVKGFNVESTDMGDGTFQITGPAGVGAFAKSENGWALLSMAPQMLAGVPADPGAQFAPLSDVYDLAVQVNVQNIPQAYREMAISGMASGAAPHREKQDNESDEEHAQRLQMMDAQLDELKRYFSELDQFTLGLAVDQETKRAFLDVAYTAVPGSKLAEEVAAQSSATTNFAGFIQPDAAMTMSFASKLAGTDEAQLDQMVETLRAKAGEAIDDEAELKSDESKAAMKEAVDDFIDVLKATLASGVMDGGAVLHLNPDALTFVAGGAIGDPAKVEAGLKKLVDVSKSENLGLPEVKWNAEELGDVKFHVMTKETPADDDAKQALFGSQAEFAVGIGPNAVYFAMGKDWLDAVKKVIDDSAASPAKSVSPMEMKVALTPVVETAKAHFDDDVKARLEPIFEMLSNDVEGRDKVTVSVTPIDNGVKFRIEGEEGVLRAAGMAAMNAQMQGAGF